MPQLQTPSTMLRRVVVGGAAVLALVLGFVGYREHMADTGGSTDFWDVLYLDLQLFAFSGGAIDGDPVPWTLGVARFLAPTVAILAAILAIAALFREQFQRWRARRWRGHVVVCGLGYHGVELVRGFRREGYRVVGIERDPVAPGAEGMRTERVPVVAGDAREPGPLERRELPVRDRLSRFAAMTR